MEQNRARSALWSQFLKVPHRNLQEPVEAFRAALPIDPDFVGKAMYALTMNKYNTIRDLVEAGIVVLSTAPAEFSILRETGAFCFQRLAPYQAIRVDDYIDSNLKVNRRYRAGAEKYLEAMFTNQARLEGALMHPGNRAGFRRLYFRYHFGEDRTPLAWRLVVRGEKLNGKLEIVGQIAKLDDPIEQAKLAADKGLSDSVLSSVLIPHPATIAVRLQSMTAPEALNARGWLEEQGWLSEPDLFKLWSERAGQSPVSLGSLEHRKSIGRGKDAKVEAVVQQAKNKAIKLAEIGRDLLVNIDISDSMDTTIQTAVMFLTRIARICTGRIMVLGCNTNAREIQFDRQNPEKSFSMIRPDGGTSLGSGLVFAVKNGFIPRTVITITDDEENTSPTYSSVRDFSEAEHIFILVGLRASSGSEAAEEAGWNVSRFFVKKDDYSALDQVSVLLQRPPGKTLVEEILELKWPVSV